MLSKVILNALQSSIATFTERTLLEGDKPTRPLSLRVTSLHLHGIAPGFPTRPLLRLDPLDKLVDHARPAAFLIPEPQAIVLHRFLGEIQRLLPEVLVDRLGPLLRLKLQPPVQPRRPRRPPFVRRRREQHLPELHRQLERERLGAGRERELERVFVHALEQARVGGEGGAALLDEGAHGGLGVDVDVRPAVDEAFAGDLAEGGGLHDLAEDERADVVEGYL